MILSHNKYNPEFQEAAKFFKRMHLTIVKYTSLQSELIVRLIVKSVHGIYWNDWCITVNIVHGMKEELNITIFKYMIE